MIKILNIYPTLQSSVKRPRAAEQEVNNMCISFGFKLLKGTFNNVKSEIHGPTCYQCL